MMENWIYRPEPAGSREAAPPAPERTVPRYGRFPCPCCGYLTFPAPKEEAVAFVCPVCFWENDVFTPDADQPSDENRGITLNQGREAFRRLGAVRKYLVRYVRKPLPEEIP